MDAAPPDPSEPSAGRKTVSGFIAAAAVALLLLVFLFGDVLPERVGWSLPCIVLLAFPCLLAVIFLILGIKSRPPGKP